MEPTEQEITAFLDALGAGNGAALGELFSAAYGDLHRLAHFERGRWSGQETLSTTALVHEAFLKLSRQDAPRWEDRGHFFRVAARAMRQILINYARDSRRVKRGGEAEHVPLEETTILDDSQVEELLSLDEALTLMARDHPRWARVVECRAFAGLDVEETAEALGISTRTVMRDWSYGQSWLYRELRTRESREA